MKFSDIPKFPSAGYEVSIPWSDLERNVGRKTPTLILEPDYQRGHVWSDEQRTAFVEYGLMGGESSMVITTRDGTPTAPTAFGAARHGTAFPRSSGAHSGKQNSQGGIDMITIPRNDDHADRAERCTGNDYPCVVCGRPVKAPKWMVHVHDGGESLVTEEEAEALNAAGREGADLGGYPIGADCLRRHPELKPYAIRQK